jgi:hypothetical protein
MGEKSQMDTDLREVAARFRPNRKVLSALRGVRAQGVARKLGSIPPELVERLVAGSAILDGQADHAYIDDVAVHWRRAGFEMTEDDKDSGYTRNLKQNVAIAKITDEAGVVLPAYRDSALASAMQAWLEQVSLYADGISLSRMNVLNGGGSVPEHVDPPDQNMIQCLLSGETLFEFRVGGERRVYRMKVGEIWWFNTTWPHRTESLSAETRLLLHTRANLREGYLRSTPESPPDETRRVRPEALPGEEGDV